MMTTMKRMKRMILVNAYVASFEWETCSLHAAVTTALAYRADRLMMVYRDHEVLPIRVVMALVVVLYIMMIMVHMMMVPLMMMRK